MGSGQLCSHLTVNCPTENFHKLKNISDTDSFDACFISKLKHKHIIKELKEHKYYDFTEISVRAKTADFNL